MGDQGRSTINIVMPDSIRHPVSLNADGFWITSPPDRVSLVPGFGVCAVQNDVCLVMPDSIRHPVSLKRRWILDHLAPGSRFTRPGLRRVCGSRMTGAICIGLTGQHTRTPWRPCFSFASLHFCCCSLKSNCSHLPARLHRPDRRFQSSDAVDHLLRRDRVRRASRDRVRKSFELQAQRVYRVEG
jgi:hypothetical protein